MLAACSLGEGRRRQREPNKTGWQMLKVEIKMLAFSAKNDEVKGEFVLKWIFFKRALVCVLFFS